MRTANRGGRARTKSSIAEDMARRGLPFFDLNSRDKPELLAQRAVSMRRPSGSIFIDGQEVADTARCCHCGGHFVMVRGSGRRRGWCLACNAMTCGRRGCGECLPVGKRLELTEKRERAMSR